MEQKLIDWSPSSENTAEECWNQLQFSITSSTEESIGRGFCSNSEWFDENADLLKPLTDKKTDTLQ